MNSLQKFAIPALALACIGLGTYAYSERLARLAAEQRLLTAQAENSRQPESLATSPASSPIPDQAADTDQTEPPPPSSGPQPTPPADRRGPSLQGTTAAEFTTVMDSPEMQQLMNLRARGTLDGRYAQLFKQLGLSPAQLQRFQELLIDKQNTRRDVVAAMRSQGLIPGRDTGDQMRALVQNANAEIDAQIRSEFGDMTFSQYQTYEQTQPQRFLVERVQQRLSYSGTALSDHQASSLVNILAQSPSSSTRSRGSGPGPGSVPITDATIAQAQAILSASQLNALQELQREQQAQAELLRRTRQNRSTGPASTKGR